jgi:hypothetical protein
MEKPEADGGHSGADEERKGEICVSKGGPTGRTQHGEAYLPYQKATPELRMVHAG